MTDGHVHTSALLGVGTAAVLLLPAFAAGRMDTQDDEPREPSAAEAAGNQDEPSREQNDEAAGGSAPSMVGTGDAPLIQAVETELSEAQGLEGASITVGVSDGTLLLSGEVSNILAHDRAIRIAASVKGVRALDDNLTVRASERPDAAIETDVASALVLDPATDAWEIDADVQDGGVTLAGTVGSYAEKLLAEKVTKGVRGVRSVNNAIDVNYEFARNDRQIAHDVTQVLMWNASVDSASIDLDVEDGLVSLSGTVDSLYEKKLAARLSWVAGVEDVNVDHLRVQWSGEDTRSDRAELRGLTDKEIRASLRLAMAWNPRVKAFEPTIEVKDGVVTLSGTVDNVKAKRAAAQAVHNTLGVTDLRNQLIVEPEQILSDDELVERVEGALLRDPYVSGFDVDVDAVDGEVYLYGDVASYFAKFEAGDAAAGVAGARDIHNEIDVGYRIPVAYTFYDWDPTLYDYDFDYEFVGVKPDDEIAASIETELAWSPFVDADAVDVTVDSGVATLTGQVDDVAERQAATENALEGGAYKVLNRLDVSLGQGG